MDLANGLAEWAQKHSLTLLLTAAALTTYLLHHLYVTLRHHRPIPSVPMVTVRDLSPLDSWSRFGEEVLAKGFEDYRGSPFQIMTGTGPKIVFSSAYASEVAKIPEFSLLSYVKPDLFTDYAGFEGIRFSFQSKNERKLPDMIRLRLTSALASFTHDLVEEAQVAIHDAFGENPEWQSSEFKRGAVRVIAQMASRVLWGKSLCRNEDWLSIAENYAIDAFYASQDLRAMDSITRPLRSWFSKSCRRLRREYKEAKGILARELTRRQAVSGLPKPSTDVVPQNARGDSISWLLEASNGTIGTNMLVDAQLAMAVSAVAPTSETMSQALRHLCEHPQYIEPLRKEAREILGRFGWTRVALYKMKLMDSFLKESMRFCRGRQGIGRIAMDDLMFADGTLVRKGTRIIVGGKFWDVDTYGANVLDFDAYRFVNKRNEPGQADVWQFAAVSPEFMGFGLGEHACPGRFFASNVIKIALALMVLNYDWDFEQGTDFQPSEAENIKFIDVKSRLRHRRRKEEACVGSMVA
ncbi:cytochrome p450 like protein [Zymoseptoria brevis]|uniref:Cytochrome p450 like protein n=1 Tax=Zymoseptoria brevis TaxID=1047168 RepID=A0A0F4G7H8_9PEZI|nr:cytochrome p450 like protein [Zymoseptoria brevis]